MDYGKTNTYDNLLPDGTDELVRITNIVIPNTFRNKRTRQKKIFEVLDYYETHGCFDKPIRVSKSKKYGVVLVDEYSRYVCAKYIYNMTYLPVKYV